MRKLLQKFTSFIRLLFTGKSDSAVEKDICDYSGQGRDKYGR